MKKYLAILWFGTLAILFVQKCHAQDFAVSFTNKGIVNRLHKIDSAKEVSTSFHFYNGTPLTAYVVTGKDSVGFAVTAPKEVFLKDADMRIDVYKGYFFSDNDEYAGALFVQFEGDQITIIYILLVDKQFIFYNGKD